MNRAVLLGAVLVVLLTLLASCTEGLKCVHCGWNFEPCCTPFPPPTECEVGDKSCFMGIYKHKLGKKAHEMRGCRPTVSPGVNYTYRKSMPNETYILESYCPTDGCNSRPLPTQITNSPFTYTVHLLCIQCGSGSAVGLPCSRPLPKPISCGKEQKSCFYGTVKEKDGTEQEMRGCHTSSGVDLLSSEFLNGTHIKGRLCDWAECNSDPPPAKPTPPPEPAECEPPATTTVSIPVSPPKSSPAGSIANSSSPAGSSANSSPVPTLNSFFTWSAAVSAGLVVALFERC